MRTPVAFFLVGLALLVGCQSSPPKEAPAATEKPAPSPVFEPARGVSCNRSTKVCENRGGPSVGLTRLFFGDASGNALDPRMRPMGYRYDRIFSPALGTSCDTLVTTCYGESGASAEITKKYFGGQAEKNLELRRRAKIQRFGSFVTCDRSSGVCYDRLGPGYGVTRMYIDEAAADALQVRLRPWAPEPPPPAPMPLQPEPTPPT